MKLILIIGSTGVGKTNLSIEYAKKYNVPVVVLDRIQCFPQLSITSGRPDEREFIGTKRYYLSNLMVESGCELISKEYYLQKLNDILYEIKNNGANSVGDDEYGCILEGGSITLLQEILGNLDIIPYTVDKIIYIRPNDTIENHKLYKSKITKRVEEMLFPNDTIQKQEVITASSRPIQVSQNNDSEILEISRILESSKNKSKYNEIKNVLISLIGLVGVQHIFNYIDKYPTLKNLPSFKKQEIKSNLIETITDLHYSYAKGQISMMDKLVKQLPNSIEFENKTVNL